jgi:type IV fimbrial biogenesis protein FimT
MLSARNPQGGFNIIEVMIAILVVALVVGLGAPSFGAWIQNLQIRTASEAIMNGLQTARSEAIKGNTAVKIVFTAPSSAFTVCGSTVSPCDSTTPSDQRVLTRAHEDGSPNAVVTVTAGGPSTVTFSPLGNVLSTNADGSLPVGQIDVTNTYVSGTAARPLRVLIGGGGSIRMCDPSPTIAATDPRHC